MFLNIVENSWKFRNFFFENCFFLILLKISKNFFENFWKISKIFWKISKILFLKIFEKFRKFLHVNLKMIISHVMKVHLLYVYNITIKKHIFLVIFYFFVVFPRGLKRQSGLNYAFTRYVRLVSCPSFLLTRNHLRSKMEINKIGFKVKTYDFCIVRKQNIRKKVDIFGQILIFCQKLKLCSKIEFLLKSRVFCQKSKLLSKIEIFVKKSKFYPKIEFLKNWSFTEKSKWFKFLTNS